MAKIESQDVLDASPFCNRSTDMDKTLGVDEASEQPQQQQRRLAFAAQFVIRLQRYGYVRLCGHGISASEIAQAFEAVSN